MEMENEHPSGFAGKPTTSETQADKEWSEFERDLDTLGRQLAALHAHPRRSAANSYRVWKHASRT